MTTTREIEVEIEPGLTYTEETGRTQLGLPVRDCFLRQSGVDEPISGLNLVSFQQRFGAVAVAAEGIGGVETIPAFRRRGHVGKLLVSAIAEIAKRVPVVFVSDAIEGLYEKFGFVNCLVEAHLTVHVRNVDHVPGLDVGTSPSGVRGMLPADLPGMIALYNQAHAERPWTHARHASWNRLLVTQTWQPGSEVITLERGGQLVGYAILREPFYGRIQEALVVEELTAADIAAAQDLLAEVAARCWRMRLSEFQVREPLDSAVGRVAQRIGCTYHQTFPGSGGMMGMILDRPRLLRLIEPELRRRLPTPDLQAEHKATFERLCGGEVVADQRDLLRLLVGHWSAAEARASGVAIAEQHERIADAWFPGGGSRALSLPYAHTLDRY